MKDHSNMGMVMRKQADSERIEIDADGNEI